MKDPEVVLGEGDSLTRVKLVEASINSRSPPSTNLCIFFRFRVRFFKSWFAKGTDLGLLDAITPGIA